MSNSTTPQVTVYSTSWCGFCQTEKQWLESLGVTFTSKDIEADKTAHDELMAKLDGDFRGVPVTDIDGDIIVGFDRPALEESLRQKQLLKD